MSSCRAVPVAAHLLHYRAVQVTTQKSCKLLRKASRNAESPLLSWADVEKLWPCLGAATWTGGEPPSLPPPQELEEGLLLPAMADGGRVAKRAIPANHNHATPAKMPQRWPTKEALGVTKEIRINSTQAVYLAFTGNGKPQ
mmetsp:Transcript_146138/g.370973  ORF Transcript_146138/g.370973 Transcript_146138/m.370973 type:complete len:141 (+) Transcript_146138:110-532(+)